MFIFTAVTCFRNDMPRQDKRAISDFGFESRIVVLVVPVPGHYFRLSF